MVFPWFSPWDELRGLRSKGRGLSRDRHRYGAQRVAHGGLGVVGYLRLGMPGESMGKPWENQENPRENYGKPRENPGRMVFYRGSISIWYYFRLVNYYFLSR